MSTMVILRGHQKQDQVPLRLRGFGSGSSEKSVDEMKWSGLSQDENEENEENEEDNDEDDEKLQESSDIDDNNENSDSWVRNLPANITEDQEFMSLFYQLEESITNSSLLEFTPKEQTARAEFCDAASESDLKALIQVKELHRKYGKQYPNFIDSRCERVNITALMHAAASGDREIVRYLLKYGADPRAVGSLNETAMHLAAYEGHADVCVELYCAAPEVLHWKDSFNATPIMRSIDMGNAYCTKTLYNMGGKIESFGPVCAVKKFCEGMQWPMLTDELFALDQHACPLCKYGYILPWVPPEFEGTTMDLSALLPPEFYPCPFPVYPRDGSGPPRAGPCWEPIINGTRLNYTGTGVAQSWPTGYKLVDETEEQKRKKRKKRMYANRQVKCENEDPRASISAADQSETSDAERTGVCKLSYCNVVNSISQLKLACFSRVSADDTKCCMSLACASWRSALCTNSTPSNGRRFGAKCTVAFEGTEGVELKVSGQPRPRSIASAADRSAFFAGEEDMNLGVAARNKAGMRCMAGREEVVAS
eukprot:750566-Hanusia_phi.AAC.1